MRLQQERFIKTRPIGGIEERGRNEGEEDRCDL